MSNEFTPSPNSQAQQINGLDDLLRLDLTVPVWPAHLSDDLAELRRNIDICLKAITAVDAVCLRITQTLDQHDAHLQDLTEHLQMLRESLLNQYQRSAQQ